jgi:PAS domain S-box-containing protein
MENSHGQSNINSLAAEISNSLLQSVLESFPNSYSLFDLDLKYIAFNKKHFIEMKKLYGVEVEIGKSILDYLVEVEDRSQLQKGLETILTGESFRITGLIGDQSLGKKYFEIEYTPFLNSVGQIVGVGLVAKDISEKFRAEHELKLRDGELNALINTIPDLVWLKNPDGVYLNCNNRFESFFGAQKEDIIGKTDYDFLEKNLADFFRNHDKNAIKAGKPTKNEEWVTFASDGHKEFLETIKTPIYDAKSRLIGVLGIGRDLTSRFDAEEHLRKSENLFKTMFETSPDIVTLTRLDNGVYLKINKSFTTILGYSDIEIVGSSAIEKNIWYQASEREELVNILRRNGVVYNHEFRFLTKTNEVVYGLMSAKIIIIDGENHLLAITRPINELKLAQDALKESEAKFRNIFECSVVGKSISSIDGKMSVNKAFCDIIGYTEQELKYLNWKDITHIDDIEFKQMETQILLSGERNSSTFQSRFIHKSGRVVWADVNTVLQRDENRKPQYFVTIVNDITDKKLAEEKVLLSEKRFRVLVENGQDMVSIINANNMIVYTSPAVERITGFTLEDLQKMSSPDFIHPDEIESLIKTRMAALSNYGTPIPSVSRLLHKDGHSICVEGTVTNMLNDESVGGIVTNYRDITERITDQQNLADSENRFRTAVINAPFPIMLHAEDGKVELVNNEWTKITGYSVQEIPTTALWAAKAYGVMEAMVREDIEKLYSITEKADEGEYVVITKTGENRNWYFSSTPLGKTIDGRKLVMSMALDLTARRNAETKLLDNEKKLSALFSSMTEMVVIHELVFDLTGKAVDYRILDCNQIFSDITGIAKEDAVGKLGSMLYKSTPPPYLDLYVGVAVTGESKELNFHYEPLDKYFMISVVSPSQNQFATITTDISEIRQIQEQITSKNKELESYLYIASHDLRSPLVNIQGFSQRLEKQSIEVNALMNQLSLNDEVRDRVNKLTITDIPRSLNFILTNVTKMDNLINSLLQISRMGRLVLDVKEIDVNLLIDNVISTYNYELTEKNVQVNINPLPSCFGDESQLNQVFSNLIGNALKYRSEDRLLEITISAKQSQNRVVYSISDNGRGIAEKDLSKIWDVFYRVETLDKNAGEGIGLSIAKTIVGKHKGRIWAVSELGIGTTFCVELLINEFLEQ